MSESTEGDRGPGRAAPDVERLHRVLERLAAVRADRALPLGTALCVTGTDVLDLPGAGITVQTRGGSHLTIGTAGRDMARLHDLELTLGEGPCVDAFNRGVPVLEPDLAAPSAPRWLAFTVAALETEARAAFGFPLQIGGTRFGALNLYATEPGPLSDDQHRDAVVLADVMVHAVLAHAAPGAADVVHDELLDIGTNQLEVHQATGMVSVQLSVGVAEALARLRARAFAEDRPIGTVAADVVARRLRFER